MPASQPQAIGFRWPLHALPTITSAGRFPLDDLAFNATYLTPSHALHLHAYCGTFRESGRDYPLLPGDLTISPARRSSAYDLPAPGHHLCIHFLPARTRGPYIELPLHLRSAAQQAFIAGRMLHIARLVAASPGRDARSPICSAAASAALQELLLQIALFAQQGRAPRTDFRSASAVEKVAGLIHEHLAQPWSVESLAREAGLSQNYLARHFRQRFGVTIKHFLAQRRIERAQQLLVSTDMPIKRIAHLVGIPDAQYFNKLFRRHTGGPPSVSR